MAQDTDPDRATVVIHAQLDGLASGEGGCAIRGRPGHPPRDRPAPAVRQPGAEGHRGLYRPAGGPGPDVQGSLGSHAPPAPVPRRRVHLPRVRGSPVHPGPSHRVVGTGRPDRSGQPDPGVLLPPQAGARVRMAGATRSRWERPVVPPRRDFLSCGTGATWPGRRTATRPVSRWRLIQVEYLRSAQALSFSITASATWLVPTAVGSS